MIHTSTAYRKGKVSKKKFVEEYKRAALNRNLRTYATIRKHDVFKNIIIIARQKPKPIIISPLYQSLAILIVKPRFFSSASSFKTQIQWKEEEEELFDKHWAKNFLAKLNCVYQRL